MARNGQKRVGPRRPGAAFHRRRKHTAIGRVAVGNMAPWFLKTWGSRPERQRRAMAEVA